VKRGADGIWRTAGGVAVTKKQQAERDAQSVEIVRSPQDEKVHTLYVVSSKYPPSPIQEGRFRIVVTEKITWAEPIMPLRGKLRTQKRFMVGALAFYRRDQAEKRKLILLARALKAGYRNMSLVKEAHAQLIRHKTTGEVL